MPYRIDIPGGSAEFEELIELGALDAELVAGGTIAALMPDSVDPGQVARTLRLAHVPVTPAVGRDADSVWMLRPRRIHVGRIRIVPADSDAQPGELRLLDTPAFGTGLHPTTALCLEWLDETLANDGADAILDVGTGSGVLALAALTLGVPRAHGLDLDDEALRVAAQNARLNGMDHRLQLTRGVPEQLTTTSPLVVANVLAAPLIEMAPTMVRRLAHHGRLLLSGIPASAESDVSTAYQRLGLRFQHVMSRDGWVALVLRATW